MYVPGTFGRILCNEIGLYGSSRISEDFFTEDFFSLKKMSDFKAAFLKEIKYAIFVVFVLMML